ncbi:MAG: hypothetical protein AAGA90_23065, partial [Actinomycetota bacterium]
SGAVRTTALTLLFAATVVAGACSVDDGSGSDARSTTTSAAPTDTAETETTTTTTLPPSVGIVELDGVSHEIDATCYAPGAGEVLATGVAATDDGRIEVYLQAFLGEPYLGIAVTGQNTVVYEAAIDRPLEISYEADILRVDDIALVTDLDLETGVGTEAGVGSVVVECRAYESELPPGFVAG